MIPLDHKGIFLFWQKRISLEVAMFLIYLPIANCYDFQKFKISKTSTFHYFTKIFSHNMDFDLFIFPNSF